MGIVLGLGAAIAYGAADFIGGLAARRASPLPTVLLSQIAGGLVMLMASPFFAEPLVAPAVWWGGASGLAGAVGVAMLWRGLAIGRMSVVAPITGILAAMIPVVFGLATGERPSPAALIGVAVALIAVALVSLAPDPVAPGEPAPSRRALRLSAAGGLEGLIAGIGFGAFFILLERAPEESGLWPILSAKVSSIALLAVGVAIFGRGQLAGAARGIWTLIVGTGCLEVLANVLFLAGTRRGLLSIVAVLTSLYPATTVVLARFVLDERMTGVQLSGLACAGAGVAMMAAG